MATKKKAPSTAKKKGTGAAKKPAPKTTKKPVKRQQKAPTRSSSARSVTKPTTKKPAAKAGKSIFAGATEISMTANKIAVTKSASQSSKGKYSEKTTREYHERTPANMRAFNDVMNNRAVKKVTVKLK